MEIKVSVIICCYNSAARLPQTLHHLAAQQELGQRHRGDETQHADHQGRLEVQRAAGADADDQHRHQGVDVQRVEREHAVLRARAVQQPPGIEQHGEAEEDLGDDQRGIHSKISIRRRS